MFGVFFIRLFWSVNPHRFTTAAFIARLVSIEGIVMMMQKYELNMKMQGDKGRFFRIIPII
jgi:hypothetical protein